jgi:DNA-binding transcriptional MerR regulator
MDLLTIADIARALDLPESTVRYYRDRFSEFVPSVGEGRTRRYRAEALEVLRCIADAMRARTPAEDVRAALQARFPVTVEPQQQSAATQQQSAAAIADVWREIAADTEKALLEIAAETATLRNELRAQQQESAAMAEEQERRHEQAMEQLCERQERQMQELKAWLENRLPPAEAKRLGLVARVRAMLRRDHRHG